MSNSQNYDGWLTKQQAAQLIGAAEKTIDRLAAKGQIQKATRKRIGQSPVTVLHPGDIARIQAEREHSPAFVVPPVPHVSDVSDGQQSDTSKAMVPRMSDVSKSIEAIAGNLARATWPPPRYLTISEAARYTGLPGKYIQRAAREGRCGKIGTRYRRADLDLL